MADAPFSPAETITDSFGGAKSVYAADVDGDGDLDVLSASWSNDWIAWYENDGAQSFTAHTISTPADGAQSVFAAVVSGDAAIGGMDAASGFSVVAEDGYAITFSYDQIQNGSYVISPTFTTFDLKAVYKATDAITAEAGVKNLTDKFVQYDLGFPVAGREFFANLIYKF